MSESGLQHFRMPFEGSLPGPSAMLTDSASSTPPSADPSDLLRLIAEANVHGYVTGESHKEQLERLLNTSALDFGDHFNPGNDGSAFGMPTDFPPFADFSGVAALRNSSKTLKCPKCNWHYKYQETLEIHMKEKHADGEVKCMYCVENRSHPKLARGESYSCGYKPYRCELCKYSTTTKGNLSIHMQSDKHLHAMQELPNSIASLSCPQSSVRSPTDEGERTFICVVCGCFSCDNAQDIIAHAEKDRSRPAQSDLSMTNGLFRCHLCQYNTNLKANFQLHTRTDKHLQRVQMVNHIREGSAGASALCRLSSAKSVFQVLCRPCQEILPSGVSLQEHCDSVVHKTNLRQPITVFNCVLCAYETQHKHEALGHMTCHEPATWPIERIDAMTMEEDAAYACASCGFTAREANSLEEHAKSHEEGEPCPLCNDRTLKLTEHLIQEHKIAESAVDKLLQVHRLEPITSVSSSFSFRCPQCCMAFRSEASLHSHSIIHLFSLSHKCPHCVQVCGNMDDLKAHIEQEHARLEEDCFCELCQESFSSKTCLIAHFNSVRHLHRAKKQLEQGSVDLNTQSPSSPGEKKPFKCNVCKIGYGQGATLDIHLRSVAHQSRMGKLGELVASGEVDGTRLLLEQPGGLPQKAINELLGKEGEVATATSQPNVMTMFNLMNMLMGHNTSMGGLSFPSTSTASQKKEDRPEISEEIVSPQSSSHLIQMLNTYGLDRLSAISPDLIARINRLNTIPDEKVPVLCKVDCSFCGETHSSIVALGVHCQEAHSSSVLESTLRSFVERLEAATSDVEKNGHDSPGTSPASRDDSEPPEKRPRSSHTPSEQPKPDLTQMAMLSMMGGFPFMGTNPLGGFMQQNMQDFFNPMVNQQIPMSQSPAKRARTRITDEQLKILRQYFDINNSPTEIQIKEMSLKAGLPEKVIKHWFRNTLFKERQRDKDSPYNFNVPPQTGIDLDTYEKTGEARVVPLTIEKREVKQEEEKKPEVSVAPAPMNLQAMMQQMHQAASSHPFQFMEQQGMMHGHLNQMSSQSSSTGRRANRTRFTDHQLRTLQQFFDKQAYPKDDDLEILSKKLQLSPRVIVVWFQNARQKARKIYENQPNHENNDRFVKTPGCNFQCKRCNLVFQRYYELIQHQQKICYKNDGVAQAHDNKGVEECLTDDEKVHLAQHSSMTAASSETTKPPGDLLKLLGGGKSSTEALLKMCESANVPTAGSSGVFHKRCPYCALLFRNQQSMLEHISTRHGQQTIFAPVDIERLPDAEDVPVLATCQTDHREMSGALDLSSAGQDRESLSMSPFLSQSDGDECGEYSEESTFSSILNSSQPAMVRSPANNKRYRTHLTPLQVHVMKCIFADYKTPSMSECETLGRDIRLHKRVVQVWFQNARAKERKSRANNGESEDVFRSTATSCSLCNVDYSSRLSLQDHLFSTVHLSAVKLQTKNDGGTDSFSDDNNSDLRSSHKNTTSKPANKSGQLGSMSMNGFPFNLLGGMMPGSALPMLDPSMFGVPVNCLQIPEAVKEQIKNDMTAGKLSSSFTHDGEQWTSFKDSLPASDSDVLQFENVEVGWGCPRCSIVFQTEANLKMHQRQICTDAGAFTLIQIHYACSLCSRKFSSQNEFVSHCASLDHQTKSCSN